jgi:quinol monooxygenase YgiN
VADISIIAKITAQPGKRDELATAMKELVEAVRQEQGTLQYILNADNKNEDVLWMWELYEDAAALEHHSGTDAFKAFGAKVGHLFAGRPELYRMTPLAGKGL